jgi:hypothetical protein
MVVCPNSGQIISWQNGQKGGFIQYFPLCLSPCIILVSRSVHKPFTSWFIYRIFVQKVPCTQALNVRDGHHQNLSTLNIHTFTVYLYAHIFFPFHLFLPSFRNLSRNSDVPRICVINPLIWAIKWGTTAKTRVWWSKRAELRHYTYTHRPVFLVCKSHYQRVLCWRARG